MVLHDDTSGDDRTIRVAQSSRAPKRRNVVWEDDGARPSSKKRSTQACLSCRSRKVRCDVVNEGTPCTNCRLDDVDCILKKSRRGQKPAVASHPPLSVPVHSPQAAPATLLPEASEQREQEQLRSPFQEDNPSLRPQRPGPSPTGRPASWLNDNLVSPLTQSTHFFRLFFTL